MPQRSQTRRAAYRARVRAAVHRRGGSAPPPRRAAPKSAAPKSAAPKPVSPRDRRRMLQLLFSDTDFVEVFSAAGRAFSEEGAIGGALNDAYTAVFGPAVPSEAPAQTAAVYTPDAQPANTDLLQQVLGFAYGAPVQGQFSSGWRAAAASTMGWTSLRRRARWCPASLMEW